MKKKTTFYKSGLLLKLRSIWNLIRAKRFYLIVAEHDEKNSTILFDLSRPRSVTDRDIDMIIKPIERVESRIYRVNKMEKDIVNEAKEILNEIV